MKRRKKHWNSVKEVSDFSQCKREWWFRHWLGRDYKDINWEISKIGHKLYSKSIQADKSIVKDIVSSLELGSEPELDKEEFKETYKTFVFPPPKRVISKTPAITTSYFINLKADLEVDRIKDILQNRTDRVRVLEGKYLKAHAPETAFKDKEHKVIGKPDVIRKFYRRNVIEELKIGETMPEKDKVQMEGYMLLKEEEPFKSVLVNLNSPLEVINGSIPYKEGYEIKNHEPPTLGRFLKNNEELLKFKKEVEGIPEAKMWGGKTCKLCDYFEIDSPVQVGPDTDRYIIRRDPKTGKYVKPGEVEKTGLEAMISKYEIEKGNVGLERAIANEEFGNTRLKALERGLMEEGDELYEKTRSLEKYANNWTDLRKFLIMSLGLKDSRLRPVGTISKLMDISKTSIETYLSLLDREGWLIKKGKDSPKTGREIICYRLKKEMDEGEKERFESFRSEMMEKLRGCGAALTTDCEEVFENRKEEIETELYRFGLEGGGSRTIEV